MSKVSEYREELKNLKDWEPYLLKESGLPGPRANLELLQAVAEDGNEELLNRLIVSDPEEVSTDSPYVFLAACGVVGLGRLVSEGKTEYLEILQKFASDPRWRIREAVAMALQIVGDKDMDFLLTEMKKWSAGGLLEKRAVAAALCEPRLLQNECRVEKVLVCSMK
jgi:hypothetical protein